MNGEPDEEKLIYRFLLGELPPDEQERWEIRLLTDKHLQDVVEAAELDLIDDYVRGSLTADEVAKFERVFLTSPERRRKLETARIFLSSPAIAGEKRTAGEMVGLRARWDRRIAGWIWNWRPALSLAAGVLIVIGIGLGIWRGARHPSSVNEGMATLKKAYRQFRPIEARISGFDYAPSLQLRGARSDYPVPDYVLREQASRILRDAVLQHPSAQSHHALGCYYLLESKANDNDDKARAKALEQAIDQLKEALRADSSNPRIHNDLGVALLEKGKVDLLDKTSGKGIESLANSLEHFNKALQLDSTLLEALFNRGLCHQQMMLPLAAREDWKQYLEHDPHSPWADEARERMKSIEEPQKRTSQTTTELLRDFLTAYRANDDEKAWQIVCRNREAITGRLVLEQLLIGTCLPSIRPRDGKHIPYLSWSSQRQILVLELIPGAPAGKSSSLREEASPGGHLV